MSRNGRTIANCRLRRARPSDEPTGGERRVPGGLLGLPLGSPSGFSLSVLLLGLPSGFSLWVIFCLPFFVYPSPSPLHVFASVFLSNLLSLYLSFSLLISSHFPIISTSLLFFPTLCLGLNVCMSSFSLNLSLYLLSLFIFPSFLSSLSSPLSLHLHPPSLVSAPASPLSGLRVHRGAGSTPPSPRFIHLPCEFHPYAKSGLEVMTLTSHEPKVYISRS